MIYFYHEMVDGKKNKLRFYSCYLHRNLFGDLQIDRKWGRIGEREEVRAEIYPNIEAALNTFFSIRALRLKKGYLEKSYSENISLPKRLVPKNKHKLLNAELSFLFPKNRYSTFSLKRSRLAGIELVGDLITLNEKDLSVIFSKHKNLCRDAVQTSKTKGNSIVMRIENVKNELRKVGLYLNSDTTHWKRPSIKHHNEVYIANPPRYEVKGNVIRLRNNHF